ncbi:MAG: glycosyltransferase [Candidatus Eisenbacteria bacterium]
MNLPRRNREAAATGHPFVVCDLVQAYGPCSGGIRTYLEAKRSYVTRKLGWKHVLVVPGPRDAVVEDGNAATYEIASPAIPSTGGYRFPPRIDKVVGVLGYEAPDLIEFGTAYLMPWAALLHRRERPCAIVGHYHTDFPEAYVRPAATRLFGSRVARRMVSRAQRYAQMVYGRCDAVLTASPLIEARLGENGIRRIHRIRLGVDLDLFHPDRRDPALRARLGIPSKDPVLVYAGRVDAEKQVEVVVRAMDLIPRHLRPWLLVIGNGPSLPRVRELASDRVIFLPYISERTEVARHLASSDLYVTAGPHETFGLSVLEAQACGLPVVGVRAGALVDRVPPEVGLLGQPGSIRDMAANIVMVLSGNRISLSRNARELAESYSWDRTFGDLAAIYRGCIAGACSQETGSDDTVLAGARIDRQWSPLAGPVPALDSDLIAEG